MATRKGQTKGSAPRRSVNRRNEGGNATETSRTVTREQAGDEHEAQSKAQREANHKQKAHVTSNVSFFQLRAEREHINQNGFREVIPAASLKFVNGRAVAVEDETLELVEAIIKGDHTDGRVTGPQFAKLARQAKLRIVYPGLVARPMETWDTLPSSEVVKVGLAAGVLNSPSRIDDAIAYEEQGPKRLPAREPREEVIHQLRALRSAVTGDIPVPTAADAARAVSSGTAVAGNSAPAPGADVVEPGAQADPAAAVATSSAPGLVPTSTEN